MFALDNHGLGQRHLQCQFEIGRQQEPIHLEATLNIHVIDDNRELGSTQAIESVLVHNEIVKGEAREFKFVLRDYGVVAELNDLVRNATVVDVGQGQSDREVDLAVCEFVLL